MSDTQQMFYQVLTNHDNQQALIFLWRDNQNQAFQDCVMMVHVFGKASFPCRANWTLKTYCFRPKGECKQKRH